MSTYQKAHILIYDLVETALPFYIHNPIQNLKFFTQPYIRPTEGIAVRP